MRVGVMRWKTVAAILCLVLLYLIMGAAVFQALEQPHETSEKLNILLAKLDFLSTHPCVNQSQLEDLVRQVVQAIRAGVNPSDNSSNQTSLWDLSSAFFFAGTVITTIGFGNTSPHTEGGRIFCIIYALLGIPLFGFLLAGVGDQLGTIFGKGIARVEKIVKWKVSQTKIRVFSTVLFILFGCLLFVSLPAAIFQHIEGWGTLDAIYFVVVTLTTIGFGDFVAGGSESEIEYQEYYKPLVWFWILVGLAYFAAILSMIGDWFRVISKKTKEEVGEFRAHAAEWTANVSAEFNATRRRLSVDIYQSFQRAASIKRRVSAELPPSPGELSPPSLDTSLSPVSPGKRTLSASLGGYEVGGGGGHHYHHHHHPAPGGLARNGSLFLNLNGLSPDYARSPMRHLSPRTQHPDYTPLRHSSYTPAAPRTPEYRVRASTPPPTTPTMQRSTQNTPPPSTQDSTQNTPPSTMQHSPENTPPPNRSSPEESPCKDIAIIEELT